MELCRMTYKEFENLLKQQENFSYEYSNNQLHVFYSYQRNSKESNTLREPLFTISRKEVCGLIAPHGHRLTRMKEMKGYDKIAQAALDLANTPTFWRGEIDQVEGGSESLEDLRKEIEEAVECVKEVKHSVNQQQAQIDEKASAQSLKQHAEDRTLHLSAAEKQKIDSLATVQNLQDMAQQLEDHEADQNMHTSKCQQQSWTNKAEKEDVEKVQKDLNNHKNNTNIHVTATEKKYWNGKANQADLESVEKKIEDHRKDGTIHVTPEDKAKWSNKANKEEVEEVAQALADHESKTDIHVSELEKKYWNEKISIQTLEKATTIYDPELKGMLEESSRNDLEKLAEVVKNSGNSSSSSYLRAEFHTDFYKADLTIYGISESDLADLVFYDTYIPADFEDYRRTLAVDDKLKKIRYREFKKYDEKIQTVQQEVKPLNTSGYREIFPTSHTVKDHCIVLDFIDWNKLYYYGQEPCLGNLIIKKKSTGEETLVKNSWKNSWSIHYSTNQYQEDLLHIYVTDQDLTKEGFVFSLSSNGKDRWLIEGEDYYINVWEYENNEMETGISINLKNVRDIFGKDVTFYINYAIFDGDEIVDYVSAGRDIYPNEAGDVYFQKNENKVIAIAEFLTGKRSRVCQMVGNNTGLHFEEGEDYIVEEDDYDYQVRYIFTQSGIQKLNQENGIHFSDRDYTYGRAIYVPDQQTFPATFVFSYRESTDENFYIMSIPGFEFDPEKGHQVKAQKIFPESDEFTTFEYGTDYSIYFENNASKISFSTRDETSNLVFRGSNTDFLVVTNEMGDILAQCVAPGGAV